MGAISIKTTSEMDLFLLQKRIDLQKRGVSLKGSNHVILYLLKKLMDEESNK